MIGVRITGGIGDQLFQYAAARALTLRLGTDLVFELSNLGDNPLYLNHFEIVTAENPQTEVVIKTVVREISDVFDEKVLSLPDNSFLDGKFQFEKYFVDQADQIRHELVLKNPMSEENSNWENKIRASRIPVSIHIPRRDSDNVPLEYFYHCVEFLKSNFPNLELFVFTNDIPFCIQNLRFPAAAHFIDASQNPHEEIFLMSLCRHHIISDENLGWWGAWLDRRESNLTFAPKQYLKNFSYEESIERIPDRWMTIEL